jgi:hypothetical protein
LSTSVYWAQSCMTRPGLHVPLPLTQQCPMCEVWGSHDHNYRGYIRLECDAV